jgi:hypothetical protein
MSKQMIRVRPVASSAGGNAGIGFQAQNQVVRPNDREIFHQPLYDRKQLSTTVTLTGEVTFFSTPVGSSDTLIRYETAASVAKTKRDTNLPSNGQDPSKDYAVFGVSMALIPNARTVLATAAANNIRRDKDNIREGGWLNFKIIDKNILDLPLLLVPEVNAEGGVSTTVNNGTIFAGPNSTSPMWSFGEPIMIPKATSFSIKLTFDGSITTGQVFDCYIFLFAKVRRPV